MEQLNPDNFGNQYKGNFEQLYLVKAGIDSITVKASATSIFGESESKNAFSECKNTIKEIHFEENSQLTVLNIYSICYCKELTLLDFLPCTKLETLHSWCIMGAKKLQTVNLPKSVRRIERSAFNDCGLTSITLPPLTHLGVLAFAYCKVLKEVIFDDNINIDKFESTFIDTSLESIRIPKSITQIDTEAFKGVYTLKSITVQEGGHYIILNDALCSPDNTTILMYPAALYKESYTIPDTITTINTRAFSYARISEFVFHDKITKIYKEAFASSNIKSAVIPDSVTTLSTGVFSNCEYLTEITLPGNITYLSEQLLSRTGITTVVIPKSVTNIQSACFEYCANLAKVILHSGISKLGGGAFTGCPKLVLEFEKGSPLTIDNQSIIYSDKALSISQYIGSESNAEIIIPSNVTTIMKSSFANAENIISITFNSTDKLRIIEEKAFYYCHNLQSINLPTTVESIGMKAFHSCFALESIHFGEKLTYIYRYAFCLCKNLNTVIFDGYTGLNHLVIYEKCFSECRSLNSLTFNQGLYELEERSMQYTTALEEVAFPSTLTKIGVFVFEFSGLKKVTFTDSMTELRDIPTDSFANAKFLKEFEFVNGVEVINVSAFSNTALENVQLPASVTTLEQFCFSGCANLTSFCVCGENSKLQFIHVGIFQNCFKLSNITLNNDYFVTENGGLFNKGMDQIIVFPPASSVQFFSLPLEVNIISPGAFFSCKNLISFMIPDRAILKKIGANAFTDCVNLQSINIPMSVEEVGSDAFIGCKSLKCGVYISNTDEEFINSLISNAKLPKNSIVSCSYFHTAVRCSFNVPKFMIFPLILLIA